MNDIPINTIVKTHVRNTTGLNTVKKDQILNSLVKISDMGILYLSDCIINHTLLMKSWHQLQYENKM